MVRKANKFSPFLELEGSVRCLQEPASLFCPRPDDYIHSFTYYFFKITLNVMFRSTLLFLSDVLVTILVYLLSSTSVVHNPPISATLVLSKEEEHKYGARHCTVLCRLMSILS